MNITLDDVAGVLDRSPLMTVEIKDGILAKLRDGRQVLISGLRNGDIMLVPQGDGLYAGYVLSV